MAQEFRINARIRLDLPVVQRGLCQHQRRQKPDGTAGARFLTNTDNTHRSASLEVTERNCGGVVDEEGDEVKGEVEEIRSNAHSAHET